MYENSGTYIAQWPSLPEAGQECSLKFRLGATLPLVGQPRGRGNFKKR